MHDFKFQQVRLNIEGKEGCKERLDTENEEQWMKPLDHHGNHPPTELDHPDHMTCSGFI